MTVDIRDRKRLRSTSLEAYRAIQAGGVVARRERDIYFYLYTNGPATARAISESVPGGWKRLSRIRELGIIAEVNEIICPVTGKQVIVWDVTDKVLTCR